MPHQAYIVDGKVWPSATELTGLLPKDFLWAWYCREVQKAGWNGWLKCKAASEEGKRLGTQVHSELDALILGAPEGSKAGDLAEAMFDKASQVVKTWIKPDTHLVSHELHLHGTCDAIVELLDGELAVLDWKTSFSKDPGHAIQLAIYALCWNEENPTQYVNKGLIVRVDKKSKGLRTAIDTYVNLDQYRPVVVALRTVWDFLKSEKA